MYYLISSSSLVLWLNIQKLEPFISTGLMECSIPLSSTSQQLEALFSVPKTHESIWGSSSTGSSYSTNTLTSTQTKLSLWSSVWDFLGTFHKVSTLFRNASYIGIVFFPSCFMDSNSGFIIKPLYYILWKSLEKCREGLPFGFWKPSELHLQMVWKPLLDLFLSSSTSKSLQIGLSYELLLFWRITLSELL